MMIRNDRMLRDAYIMVLAYTQYIADAKHYGRKIGNSEMTLADIKRNIREYQRGKDDKYTLVKDYGDGYLVRFDMPDTMEPEQWFDDHERLTMTPSAHDCTGQAFTAWHEIHTLGGRKVCWHMVAFDV